MIRISPSHLAIVAIVSNTEDEVEAAVGALQALKGASGLHAFDYDLVLSGARIVRVIATTGSAQARSDSTSEILKRDGVPVVAVAELARRLRYSEDPDHVWLNLAAADDSQREADDSWLPRPAADLKRGAAPSERGSPARWDPMGGDLANLDASQIGDLEAALNRLLLRCGLPPIELWPSARLSEGHWELIDPGSGGAPIMFLASDIHTGNLVLTEVSTSVDALRHHHVALTHALLHELGSLATTRFRRPTAITLWLELLPSGRSTTVEPGGGRRLRIAADKSRNWVRLRLEFDALEAATEWLQVREGASLLLIRLLSRFHPVKRRALKRRWQHLHTGLIPRATLSDPALGSPIDLAGSSRPAHGTLLASRLRREAIGATAPPGREPTTADVLTGGQATSLIEQRIVPGLQLMIETLLGDIDPEVMLGTAVAELQRNMAVHLSRTADLANQRLGPWIDDHVARFLMSNPDSLLVSRATEMTVEMVLRSEAQRTGSRQPDRIDVAMLQACAETALSAALARQADIAGIDLLEITVGRAAEISIGRQRAQSVDIRAYMDTVARYSASNIEPAEIADPTKFGEQPFIPLSRDENSESVRLHDLSEALRALTGTSLNGLAAVLSTAADLPMAGSGIAATTPQELAENAASWSGLTIQETRSATDLLTLDVSAISSRPYEFWKLEARPVRVATRPLVATPQRSLLIAPARVRATQKLFTNYLIDGRFPWPTNPVLDSPGYAATRPQPAATTSAWIQLNEAMRRFRQRSNRELELALAESLRDAGWAAKHGIKPSKKGVPPGLPGEIDSMTADRDRKVLWILEAKDPQLAFSPTEIGHSIAAIHGSVWTDESGSRQRRTVDQVAKLNAKVAAVKMNLSEWLQFLKIETDQATLGSSDDWQVAAAFVTRVPTAAAFVIPPRSLFVLAENVPRILTEVDPAHLGFAWIPAQ